MEIRPVGADDLEQELDLRVRAFGPLGGYRDRIIEDNLAAIAAGEMLGAYDDGRLIGTARCLDLRQWWGGRPMPMGGVSGVKVAPEARGRGVAKALMAGLMSMMAERRCPVSLLYPSTPGLYRALGWEFAGGFYRTEIAARALTSLLPADSAVAAGLAGSVGVAGAVGVAGSAGVAGAVGVAGPGAGSAGSVGMAGAALERAGLRRAGPDDAEQVIAVMSAVHDASAASGPTSFGVDDMRRGLAEDDEFAYLADDGFISYGFDGGSRAIEVSYLAAGSAATAAAIWGILGSHSTVTRTVSVFLSPSDPIGLLLKDSDIEVRLHKRPMLRVIDPAAAVAARGFPPGVQCTVDLRLADATLPANSGSYRLTVGDGTGTLVRVAAPSEAGPPGAGGPGAGRSGAAGAEVGASGAGRSEAGGSGVGRPLLLGARGFAALFAGTPVSTLRVAGLAAGGDVGADALFDSAFACRPFMTDSF